MEKPKVYGTEEAIAQLITQLMDVEKNKVKMLSDIDDLEIGALTVLSCIGEKLKLKSLTAFVDNFCRLRISRYRLGRREAVRIASYSTAEAGERKRAKSIRDLFAGIR